MSSSPPATFRTDINGLRAFAVLAVMLYHFGVPGFGGGFIGVDVFFVISGFLMTRILIESINGAGGGHWQWLWNFYLARARRIVPALLALCLVLLILGWYLLPSPDYRTLGTHTLFALTFLSNIKFWREAGYFDAASHDKWLLHTWSLSVEWQFYLLFPLLILLVWRLFTSRRAAFLALLIGFAASLFLSVLITPRQPSAAFFLLPTRAWELFAGGLVYLLGSHWRPGAASAWRLEGIGFLLIFTAATAFSADSAWPGYRAVLPVAGAMLVLLAARQASPWTHPRPLQAIGNWSYSIYLWHWPVVVALVYLERAQQIMPVLLGLGLSILLGWLSYTWVENPGRRLLARSRPWPATAMVAGLILLVAMPAYAVRQTAGFARRLPPEVELIAAESGNFNYRRTQCHGWGGMDFHRCVYGGEDVSAILVGDSHAESIVTAVFRALPTPEQGLLSFTYNSCPTIFEVKNRDRPDLKCAEFNDWVMREIAALPHEVPLIIANRTSAYVYGSNRPDESDYEKPYVYFDQPVASPTREFQAEFVRRLTMSVCRIANQRRVYMVRPIPEMSVDVPKFAARKQLIGQRFEVEVSRDNYEQRHSLVWAAQDLAHNDCKVHILDPLPWLCEDTHCPGLRNGRPLYYDSHHLSEYGNQFLIPMFQEIFKIKDINRLK